MSANASTWTVVQRASVVLGLLMLAGGLMANTLVSSQTVSFDPQAEYTPADDQGRFTYMIDFVEPSVIDQHRSRSTGDFQRSAPANAAWRSQLQALQAQRIDQMSQALGRSVTPSHYFLDLRNGIALNLAADEAQRVASLDGVKSVERERLYSVDTFRGPDFIGAPAIWDGSATPDGSPLRGELMVAAILDSGIGDPSVHPSFDNDPDCGHGVGAVPDKVISNLDCSSSDVDGLCNGTVNPFDENGHGSHTASTTAGNRVTNADSPSPELPPEFDSISGVAYCAHIRSYDVCSAAGGNSCGGADLTAGMASVLIHTDPAVIGAIPPVSVMNYSISGGRSPWADFDRTKLDLVDAGVFVAASAGNTSGGEPDPVGLVSHRGPWVMSVAASTHDGQIFDGNVSLAGGPQDVAALEGSGPSLGSPYTGQLRWAGDVDAANNLGCVAFPANAFDGEAALIERGECTFVTKVDNAVAAGANFVIVYTDDRAPVNMAGLEATTVSAFMINRQPGLDMVAALGGGTAEVTVNPEAVGVIDPAAGDILAGFSLRGPTPPPLQDLQKPNITAPGVNIFAADVVAGGAFGFGFKSGTSMSSPHVAGSAVLVRQANPDWTVSETKSAMQMTASRDGLKDDGTTPWDWDDVGHGRVDLNDAALAGFVLDETFANYLAADPGAGGDVKTLNTPDIRNVDCSPSCSFTRTIRNTYDVATDWTVTVDSFGSNVDIQVTPATFSFTGDTSETQEITIDVAPLTNMNGEIEFGVILFDEDASAAPQAHFTTAIAGNLATPPAAAVDQTEFTILLEEGAAGSASFNISNVGEGALVEDLNYTIDEASPATVVLSNDREASPPQDIELILDGVAASIARVGVPNQNILWFNQFTPSPLDLPFDLTEIEYLEFVNGTDVQVGDEYDVFVWSDPDRVPGNGDEVLLSSVLGETLDATGFALIPLPAPVSITEETGDVLIGLVNRSLRDPSFPANGETTTPSQGRSWIAFNFPGGLAGSPPDLAAAATFATIDDLGLPRNWVIRGFGTGGSACLTPSDVPWLTVTPNDGTVAGGESQEVVIDVDSTGLAQGTYEARVCLNTNDENNPVFVLPVTMEVTGVGGLPTIDVAPATVDTTVGVLNPVGSETLDISNTGNDLDLEWSIGEAEALASNPFFMSRQTNKGAQPFALGTLNGSRVIDSADLANLNRVTRGVGNQQLISVNGFTTGGAYDSGDPDNTQQSVAIGLNTQIIGVGWEVNIETAANGSWLSESTVTIVTNQGDTEGLFLAPGAGDDTGGTVDYSSNGVLLFADVTPDPIPPISADASGNVFLEWNESFDDAPGVDSTWNDSSAPVTLPAGLTLLVEQLGPPPTACDFPSDISWLSVSPTTGTTPAGGTESVTVDFDGTGLAPGVYEAVLCVISNDPATPLVEVPVSMTVNQSPSAAEIAGVVQGLGRCQADPILAAGAEIEIVGSIETITVTADANGEYSAFLNQNNGPVDITASAPNHISFTESGVAITGGATTTVDFGLVLEVPCPTAAPSVLSAVIEPDSTTSDVLTLSNELGGADYTWSIDLEEVSGSPRGGVDPVQDGSFETGTPNAAWAEFSAAFGTPLCSEAGCGLGGGTGPRTGDWWTWFGGIASAESGSVSQDVTIPVGPSAELRFWLEIPAAGQPGFMDVSLDGNVLFSVTDAEAGDYPVYTEVVLDVSSFADGGTYALEFASETEAGAAATNFFVDDVSLVVQPGPVGCADPQGVPWLSVDTAAGTLAAGATEDLTMTFDSTGVPVGDYQANVCVTTDDAEAELIIVPVEFSVLTDDLFQDRFEGVIRSVDPQEALRKINN